MNPNGARKFPRCFFAISIGLALFSSSNASAQSLARKFLHGHVPAAAARLAAQGLLPATNHLHLAIGLPLRNEAALDELLRQIYDPASPNYRHYLTPAQFTEQFGPTEPDYQKVIAFARAHGLTVTGTYGNRVLLDVSGPVVNVENAFQVTLHVYQHPKEARKFFAPDSEPSVDTGLPVMDISGLDNYELPHPKNLVVTPAVALATPRSGSGSGGTYLGNDFRTAYLPGVSLDGTGQTVGLLEFDGYYTGDITSYESQAGLPGIPLQNVAVNGGVSSPGSGNVEVALDIEMAIAMAPNLSAVVVFEAPNSTANFNSLLNTMVSSNQIKQFSCSWGGGGANASSEVIFKNMAAQGQSFFNASGDSDAFIGAVPFPSESTNITQVGGTTLTTSGPGGAWISETVWNRGGGVGSSGGISTAYAIPTWQQGISMTANQGSIAMRNIPDVALTAENIFVAANNGGSVSVGGTSCAAPLWAGLIALANQQAANNGQPPLGFINPAIYEIGRESTYAADFHDITTGNNTSPGSPANFNAVAGYDLCTGWGTPAGGGLINALLGPDPLVINPVGGFNSSGLSGGPFNMTSQIFLLTNSGAGPLNWSAGGAPSWLNISSNGGTLASGGSSSVTVSLNSTASTLAVGTYTGYLWLTNLTSGIGHSRLFTLQILAPGQSVVQNGGFETGDFSLWTYTGNSQFTSVTSGDTNFVHTGTYGARLGPPNTPGFISQTLPTLAGQTYLLSCWLGSPDGQTPNSFQVIWNGNTIFNRANIGKTGWTNLQFIVTASSSSTVLQLGFQDNPTYLGLDDISVTTISLPSLSVQPTNQTVFAGSNAVFSAAAGGSSPLIYHWRKTGTNLVNGGNISGATSNALTLTAVTTNNSGNYTLVVTNAYGSITSSVAALTVLLPPAITSSLTNRIIQCGANAAFTITASGTPPLIFQWSVDSAAVAGATNVSFTLTNVHSSHSISVIVTNFYGSATSNAVLTVQDTTAPAITLNGGNPIFIELGAAFINPGATATDICAGAVAVVTGGAVNISAVGTNLLIYSATDGNGNTNLVTRTVVVRDTTPPVINWSFTNLVLAADTNCGALMPDLTVTNFILATDLSGALAFSQNPTNHSTLPVGTNLVVITIADASGNAAFSTNTIVVKDQTPPVILTGPKNCTNTVGTTAHFSVAATACTPLACQWFFNSAVLAGQTSNTLVLTSVSPASAGNYSVVVSASGGSTTSIVATLAVKLIVPNLILTSSENPSGYGDDVKFSAALTPASAAGTLQFLTNNVEFDTQALVAAQATSTNLVILPRGTNFITVIYSGDTNDLAVTNILEEAVTNHPPAAVAAFYTCTAGIPLDIAIADLATNWSDVDGDTISLADVSVSTNGVTVTNAVGTLIYFSTNPVADQFVCTISDDFGGSNLQTVNVTVLPPPNLTPGITSVSGNSDGSFTLNLAGASAYTYILETTTDLYTPVTWQPLATNTLDTNGVWQFNDTSATNFSQRFYRLKLAQ